jgi:hypothetical protein
MPAGAINSAADASFAGLDFRPVIDVGMGRVCNHMNAKPPSSR